MIKDVSIAGLLLAELVRQYSILQVECALLEVHEISWFLQKAIDRHGLRDELDLKFEANYYGPYANNLMHLLNGLDGSYLKSDKRIPDCNPLDVIWFNDQEKERVALYLRTEAKDYLPALEETAAMIDGFESPYGMELLATVDWLLVKENCQPTLHSIKEGLAKWPAGKKWADRKLSIFDDRSLQFAINRLSIRSAA